MATSLTTTLTLRLKWLFTNALDLSTPEDAKTIDKSDGLTNGTGADKAEAVFHDRRSLNNATENLDLAGSLTDAFGNTLTFQKIKAILIHNRNTVSGEYLVVGGAAANQFLLFKDASDKVIIHPNGMVLIWAPTDGYTVTADTGDILKIDADESGANISYDIVIIGEVA